MIATDLPAAGTSGNPNDLLRRANICAYFDVDQRTLSRWLATGAFPQPDVKRGKRFLRWRRATIESWASRQSGNARY